MSLRVTLVFLLFGIATFSLNAQREAFDACDEDLLCKEFDAILRSTLKHLDAEDGAAAYRELKALEACDKCPEHRDNLDALSDEIISLFQKKNDDLDSLLNKQRTISQALQKRTNDLNRERSKVERQLFINEEMTRDALVTNYMRLANNYFENGDQIDKQEALWLTDFTYNYIDSTHEEVKRMMHLLLNDKIQEELPFSYFDGESGYLDGELYEEKVWIAQVKWSPDEKWLAVGMDNGRLLIFSEDGTLVFDQFMSTNEVNKISWKANSNELAFAQDYESLRFLELQGNNWQLTERILTPSSTISTFDWSPTDNNLIAIATQEELIFLYEEEIDTPVEVLRNGHDEWIRDLAWSPDGKKIISGDDQGTLAIWDVEEAELLFQRNEHTDYVRTVDWHPDGDKMMSGGDDGTLIIWDTAGTIIENLPFEGWVYQAEFSASGNLIGVITSDGFFYRILFDDPAAYEEINLEESIARFSWRGERNTAQETDGELLAQAAPAKFLIPEASQASNDAALAENAALNSGFIHLVDWSQDGEFLACTKGYELTIIGREVINHFDLGGVELLAIDWHPGLSTVLSNTNFLATIGSDNRLLLWDATSLTIEYQYELDMATRGLSWSRDGYFLAIGNDAGELRVFDPHLNLMRAVALHSDYIRALAWSPSGKYIATCSDDRSVIIYDWSLGKVVDRLEEHADWVKDVVWLDETHLASASDDGQTIIWEWLPEQNQHRVMQRLDNLDGYHESLAYDAGSSGSVLAVGTSNEQLGLWILNSQLNAKFDTVFQAGASVADLDWHPSAGTLALSGIGSVPRELVRYETFRAAYEGADKEVVFKSYETALYGSDNAVLSHFYLPDIVVKPGLFDQVVWSPDEQFLCVVAQPEIGVSSNKVEIHKVNEQSIYHEFHLPETIFSHAEFSPNNEYLALAPENGRSLILPLNALDDTIFTSQQKIMDWTWSGNSRYLAILDINYDVFVYDLKQRQVKWYKGGIDDYDQATVLFHPQDDRRIYLLSHKGVYELNRNENSGPTLIYEPTEMGLDSDSSRPPGGEWINGGNSLLYVRAGSSPVLLRIQNAKASVQHVMGDQENYYTWAGDPAKLMYEIHLLDATQYNYNGKELEYTKAWDVSSGRTLSTLRGVRKQVVEKMTLSADGKYLATLGAELNEVEGKYQSGRTTLIVWELESGREILEMSCRGARQVNFSPMGNYLHLYFENGRVGIWPLDLPKINAFFAQSGKDRYLEQLSSKDNEPFLNRIEEWELEKGLNFNEEENFALLHGRELPRIRQNWGAYFVDQAWFSVDDKAANINFDKATFLHFEKNNPQRVRPTKVDSSALTNIWIEQAYYELSQGRDQLAQAYINRAKGLNPKQERLDMLQLLLDWQEGERLSILKTLQSDQSLALQAEYDRWGSRDIHITNEIFFYRLVALTQSQMDPVSPIVRPKMNTLLNVFPQPLRDSLLLRYYRINNREARDEGVLQAILEEATDFLEDRWEKTKQSEQELMDYGNYNYELRNLLIGKKKYEKALARAIKNVEISRELIRLKGEGSYAAIYLNSQADKAFLDLQITPKQVARIRDSLTVAQQSYPNASGFRLGLQLGHCELLLGNHAAAYQIYYQVMEGEFGSAWLETRILEEMGQLKRAELPGLERIFRAYQDYDSTRGEYIENSNPSANVDLAEDPEGVEAYAKAYETGKAWYDKILVLHQQKMLPNDSLRTHTEEFNKAAADYIYALLYVGEWQEIQQPLQDIRSYWPQRRWPKAVEAITHILKDDWPAADARLREVRNTKNDGIQVDDFPNLSAFLLNLPSAIQIQPDFQKWENRWRRVLD